MERYFNRSGHSESRFIGMKNLLLMSEILRFAQNDLINRLTKGDK